MLQNLGPTDRRIAVLTGAVASLVLVGLVATGVVELVTRETNPRWLDSYSPGFRGNRGSNVSVGSGSVHGDLGDVAAIVSLWAAAWFSLRVIFRISWVGVFALVLTIVALITGGLIDIRATVTNGNAEGITNGYAQIFGRDIDVVITDRYELGATTAQVLTVVHSLTTPVLLFVVWIAAAKAKKRPTPRTGESWLDLLDHKDTH